MSQAKTRVFSVVQREQPVPAHVRLDACVLLIGCGPRFLTGRRKRLEDVTKLSQELRGMVTEDGGLGTLVSSSAQPHLPTLSMPFRVSSMN